MSKAKQKRIPVTIIGGGMVGLALANALAQAGISVRVLDKVAFDAQNLPAFDGRVSAISYGSQIMLENIGVWDGMKPYAQPINDIRVAEVGSPVFVHYDHKDVGDVPMGHIIENRHIRMALQQKAEADPNITLQVPAIWQDIAQTAQGVSITLEGGEVLETSLLIATDGKFSAVRKKVAIPTVGRDYEQTAIVGTISHALPHYGLALEKFLPVGPFAVLPMLGNKSSLVWVEPADKAALLMKLDRETITNQIQERVGEYLGDVELDGKLFSYPLSLVLAKQYYQGRVLLAGDAAHGIHPISGQGVNLGFRDVAVLAQLLPEAMRLGQDPGSSQIMQGYEQWRRFDITAMGAITDGINNLFINKHGVVKLLRNAGLAAVNKAPVMKQFFMQHAMGVTGDLPELMQKKAG